MNMKETLKKVCNTYGPTGNETVIASVIKEMLEGHVDSSSIDAMGNLIAYKKGSGEGKKIMLAAHMDQIGLMATYIEDNGFIRVATVGGMAPYRIVNRQVRFEDGTSGVVGQETKVPRKPTELTVNHLYIDIGAYSKEDAAKKVKVGDIAVFMSEFLEMGQCASSAAMDNRAGCAVLIETMRNLGDVVDDIYAVFTTQEEVGLRGARAAAFGIKPDYGVALDVTPAGDTPESMLFTVDLGKGAAVKIKDNSLICNPSIVKWLEDAAINANITWQREVLSYGGTAAGAMQLSRGGVPSGVISVPCRYVHSPAETVDIRDVVGATKLLITALTMGSDSIG